VTRRRSGERDVGGGFGGGRGGLGGVETDATFVEEVFEGEEFRGGSEGGKGLFEVGNDGVVFGMFFGEDETWVATEFTEVLEERLKMWVCWSLPFPTDPSTDAEKL